MFESNIVSDDDSDLCADDTGDEVVSLVKVCRVNSSRSIRSGYPFCDIITDNEREDEIRKSIEDMVSMKLDESGDVRRIILDRVFRMKLIETVIPRDVVYSARKMMGDCRSEIASMDEDCPLGHILKVYESVVRKLDGMVKYCESIAQLKKSKKLVISGGPMLSIRETIGTLENFKRKCELDILELESRISASESSSLFFDCDGEDIAVVDDDDDVIERTYTVFN